MSPLTDARGRFPSLAATDADGRPFVWADAPGGSQMPDTVIDAIARRIRHGVSNTHGAFSASEDVDALIAGARVAAADLLGADPGEIVFGPNATTLLLHLSRSFGRTVGPGDEVVVTRLDHDANIRPWVLAAADAGAEVRWVDIRPDDVTLDLDALEDALSTRTRLVACTLASNAVGTIPPVAEIIARAKSVGSLVALDGVHFAQHTSIDLHGLGADLVVVSPYKFFGPHQGVAAVRRELLETWTPYKLVAAPDENPDRWETGTQSHEALAGTIAAIDYLAELADTDPNTSRGVAVRTGYAAIHALERELTRRFLDGVSAIPHVRLFGIADRARLDERTPTFAVRVGDQHPLETSKALASRGIFTWDGHYYAIELMQALGLLETGGAVRIGFCHYHSAAEVDRVLEALADLA